MTHQISSSLTSHDFVGEECVLSVVMTNILTKHNLRGKKGLFLLTDYSPPLREIRKELKQEPEGGHDYYSIQCTSGPGTHFTAT